MIFESGPECSTSSLREEMGAGDIPDVWSLATCRLVGLAADHSPKEEFLSVVVVGHSLRGSGDGITEVYGIEAFLVSRSVLEHI